MKVGDLVKVNEAPDGCDPTCAGTLPGNDECGCWFCSHNSTRMGIIVKKLGPRRDPLGTIAPHAAPAFGGYWSVLFDAGEWRLYGKELEVISESR